jgi:DNA modification methylase
MSRLRSAKRSPLLDTHVIYCGDNLDQPRKLPEKCVDLIYIDPPFNSNRNYYVPLPAKRRFHDSGFYRVFSQQVSG